MTEFSLLEVILISLAITLTVSHLFFRIRSALLGRHVLETTMSTMKSDHVYTFVYKHSMFNGRRMEITVPDDDTSYIMTETTYYNYKKQVSVSVFTSGLMVYNAELRNVIYSDYEPIREEGFDGNL